MTWSPWNDLWQVCFPFFLCRHVTCPFDVNFAIWRECTGILFGDVTAIGKRGAEVSNQNEEGCFLKSSVHKAKLYFSFVRVAILPLTNHCKLVFSTSPGTRNTRNSFHFYYVLRFPFCCDASVGTIHESHKVKVTKKTSPPERIVTTPSDGVEVCSSFSPLCDYNELGRSDGQIGSYKRVSCSICVHMLSARVCDHIAWLGCRAPRVGKQLQCVIPESDFQAGRCSTAHQNSGTGAF